MLETQRIENTFNGRMSLDGVTSFLFSNDTDTVGKIGACSILFSGNKTNIFNTVSSCEGKENIT